MRAALLALLLVLPAAAMESSGRARLEQRIDEALRRGSDRAEDAVREELDKALWTGSTPLDVIRRTVSTKAARKAVWFLASDELGGRDTGSEGFVKAAEWAEKRFEKAGLKPAGTDGWRQPWKFGKKTAFNVCALLPGETDEIVVVGAHLDHIGTGAPNPFSGRMHHKDAGDDKIFNGADDNASGSAAIVLMAEALAKLPAKPRRGILFILFSGEEKGLLGAAYWCKNPTVPLAKAVAMVNLDMVGRNKDRECMVTGGATSPELAAAVERANRSFGMKLFLDKPGAVNPIFNQSDQLCFYNAGIPAIFFTTGIHREYHTELDHADLINYDKIEEIAELGALTTLEIANLDQRPTYVKKVRNVGFGKPRLGVTMAQLPDDLRKENGIKLKEGAVLINGTTPGYSAAAAGLKAGDIIVSWNGKSLPREKAYDGLRDLIFDADEGAEVTIGIVRGEERLELTVKLDVAPAPKKK